MGKNKNKNKLPTTAPPAAAADKPAAAAAVPPRNAPAASSKPAPAKPAAGNKAKSAASSAAAASAAASSTPSPAPVPSLLSAAAVDDEAPLQRGNKPHRAQAAAAATPSATADAEQRDDVLFGNKRTAATAAAERKDGAKGKKRKGEGKADGEGTKKSRGDAASDEGDEDRPRDLFTGAAAGSIPRHLTDPLSHGTLKAGMVVLGAVRAVNEVDLTVQLPHGLTGYVSMREVSDPVAAIVDAYIEAGEKAEAEGKAPDTDAVALPVLSQMMRVGQLVQCYILSVGEHAAAASDKHSGASVSSNRNRRIEISLRASLFNSQLSLASLAEGRLLYGAVKSVQEKGYVVDVGIDAPTGVASSARITAFLPFNKAPADQLLPPLKRSGRPTKEELAAERRLPVGTPLLSIVTNAKNKRVLVLSAEPDSVRTTLMRNSSSQQEEGQEDNSDAAAKAALDSSIGFTNLQPGQLVRARIERVVVAGEKGARSSGLFVRFLDFFSGFVDNLHSSADAAIEGALQAQFRPGQNVTARILYINYVAKKIALSLLPHIVALEPYSFPSALRCGDRIDQSVVTKVEPKLGVYFRLPVPMEGASEHKLAEKLQKGDKKKQKDAKPAKATKAGSDDEDEQMEDAEDAEQSSEGEDEESEEGENSELEVDDEGEPVSAILSEQSVSAWAHLSRLADTQLTSVPKSFSVGATVPSRILNLHYVDAVVHVSTQPAILAQSILYYEDVEPGMEVQSIKARVLNVDGKSKKIICTLKKSLLTSALPKLFNYTQATPGTITHGYIGTVKEYGLIVEFYANTHGLVSTSDLVRSGFLKEGQSPSEAFKRGEVHKVRVVSCDAKRKKMQLSLGLTPTSADSEVSADERTLPGSIVAATVAEVKKDGLLLALEDPSAPAAPKEEKKGKKANKAVAVPVSQQLFLPTAHLTDHPSLADALLHTYPVGHRFDRLVVLQRDSATKLPLVSAKPTFLAAVERGDESVYALPSRLESLPEGSLLLGFVRAVADFGLFVGFLDGCSALAPRNMLADQFVGGDLSSSFAVGQTLRARVVAVEEREGATKLTLTLKPSALAEGEREAKIDPVAALRCEGAFAASYFADQARLASKLGDSVAWSSAFPLSGAFDGSVKLIKDFGLVLQPAVAAAEAESVQGLVTRPYHTNEPLTKKAAKAAAEEREVSTEAGDRFELGASVRGKVLDVDRLKKIVDVSLRPELVQSLDAAPAPVADKKGASKKRKSMAASGESSLQVGSWVQARVQLVRKQYVVLSVPSANHAIGYALTVSTNSRFNPHSVFQPGQDVRALVHSVPSPSSSASPSDRLLLVLDLGAALESYSKNKAAASSSNLSFVDSTLTRMAHLQNGRVLQVQIRGVTKPEADGLPGPHSRLEVLIGEVNGKPILGSVHPSQLEEPLHARVAAGDKEARKLARAARYEPLRAWAGRVGETVTARIMSVARKVSEGGDGGKAKSHIGSIDLTLRPSLVNAPSEEEGDAPRPLPHLHLSDVKAGSVVQAYVRDVEAGSESREGSIWLSLAPSVKARVRANELSFPDGASADLSSFRPGQALTCQVLDVHANSHLVDLVLLPLGSSKPKQLDSAAVERVRRAHAQSHHHGHDVKVGSHVRNLTVRKILPAVGLLVSWSSAPASGSGSGAAPAGEHYGRVHITDLSDRWTRDPLSQFRVGQSIPRAVVVAVGEEERDGARHQQVDLSLRQSRLSSHAPKPKYPEIHSFDELVGAEGRVLQAYVKHVSKSGVFVSLSRTLHARCMLKHLADGFVADPAASFPPGLLVPRVRLLKVDPESRAIEVSFRRSDGSKDEVGPSGAPRYTFEELKEGQVVKAVVTSVKPFGVFLRLKQSSVSGLCHISNVSDKFVSDLGKHYSVGDRVRAKVVKKEEEGRRIGFSLKAADIADAAEDESDSDSDEDEEEEADEEMQQASDDEGEGDSDEEEEDEQQLEEDEDAVAQPKSRKSSAAGEESPRKKPRTESKAAAATPAAPAPVAALPAALLDDGDEEMADAPALDLNASYSMLTGAAAEAQSEGEDESDADDEGEDEEGSSSAAKKKSRRAKAGAKKAEERALAEREHAILDPSAQPESADEFERVVAQNPNASLVWIKYMAYQISLTEIDAARKIADRALKAISFRHPQEKLNVWLALLNLENMYGSQRSMQETFQRATQFNDPLTVYMEVAKIYAATKKTELAIETYEAALKKFHALPSIWQAYASFLYAQPGRVSDARELLKRALQRVDKADHIGLIVKFAGLEFHVAHNADRGRTLLEGVLDNYPRRTDLWNVYLDMETKLLTRTVQAVETAANPAAAKAAIDLHPLRRLYDRITAMSMSTKKMKFFFKRALAFEKTLGGGDPDRIEAIKQKARQYVASKTGHDDSMSSSSISDSAAWRALSQHASSPAIAQSHLRDLLQDSGRVGSLQAEFDGIVLDYSRQRVTQDTMNMLFDLAEAADVRGKVQRMKEGAHVNNTEDRAAMHIALRAAENEVYNVDGENVVPAVHAVLQKIRSFSEAVRSGSWKGATGKPLTSVVAIGIGGSYLGANFVSEALSTEPSAAEQTKGRTLRFLANVDPVGVARALEGLNPETTLAIVISKTFTTRETILNARTVRQWFLSALGDKPEVVAKHMVAVSTNLKEVAQFGIDADKATFAFWDWVGGRYSVTSAVGLLPLALHYSYATVERFLAGCRSMDAHFLSAPPRANLPYLLGLLGVWNNNFLGFRSRAIAAYSEAMLKFAPHIQQVDMESNGKRVNVDGAVVNFSTGEVNFGEPGTNAQHSFFQLFHQGQVVPVDFIGFCQSQNPINVPGYEVSNHDELMANFFAQPDALACGKTAEELQSEGVSASLIPHRVMPGNRPSNVLLLPRLTAYEIGQLLALYEHRTGVQGFVWQINSFDQFGVELGKKLADKVRAQMIASRAANGQAEIKNFNPSTTALLNRYFQAKF